MHAAIRESRLQALPLAKHLGFLEQHETSARYIENFARSINGHAEPAVAPAEPAAVFP